MPWCARALNFTAHELRLHACKEAVVTESWREERDRILKLLDAIKNGDVSHIDEEGLRELQEISPENVADLHARLSLLNKRLGDRG